MAISTICQPSPRRNSKNHLSLDRWLSRVAVFATRIETISTENKPLPPDSTPHPFKDICPLLGLPGDPSVSFSYPSPENSCFAVEPSGPVRMEHQSTTCLSGSFKKCGLYRFYNRPDSRDYKRSDTLPPETLQQALDISGRPAINPLWVTLALAAVLLLAGFRLGLFEDVSLSLGSPAARPGTRAASRWGWTPVTARWR